MIQCSSCECWVHANCEELTDEMYQLIACLPDDYQYRCKVCERMHQDDDTHYPSAPKDHKPLSQSSYWQKVLQAQLLRGLLNVLTTLLGSKCTQVLQEATNPPSPTPTHGLINNSTSLLSVKDNGVRKHSPKLSALLWGQSQPSTSIPATSFNVNLNLSSVSKTLFQANDSKDVLNKQSQKSPILASTVSVSFVSDSITSVTSMSTSVSSQLKGTPTKNDVMSSFYTEFQKFISNARPSDVECSTSSSESSIALSQEILRIMPSTSSSPSNLNPTSTQLPQAGNTEDSSAPDVLVPSSQQTDTTLASTSVVSQVPPSTDVMTVQRTEETPTKSRM
ncbi:histone-lysine N-methyltransferase, partial [Elysia marginata]